MCSAVNSTMFNDTTNTASTNSRMNMNSTMLITKMSTSMLLYAGKFREWEKAREGSVSEPIGCTMAGCPNRRHPQIPACTSSASSCAASVP
jgi:hypothetical protein